MSHISAIYGTDSDAEILNSLYTIANVRSFVRYDVVLETDLQPSARSERRFRSGNGGCAGRLHAAP